LNAAELKKLPNALQSLPTGIALIFFLHFSAWLCVDSRRRRRIDPGSSRLWRHRGYQLPLWVNKDHGISKKYGIELSRSLISGGALNMQALLAGSIQMSQNSASSALQAALRGAPWR